MTSAIAVPLPVAQVITLFAQFHTPPPHVSILRSPQRVYWVHPLRVGLGILPVGLFLNGHSFFVSDMPGRVRLKPYTVHASTHLAKGAGPEAVKARLRSAGVCVAGGGSESQPLEPIRSVSRRRTARGQSLSALVEAAVDPFTPLAVTL